MALRPYCYHKAFMLHPILMETAIIKEGGLVLGITHQDVGQDVAGQSRLKQCRCDQHSYLAFGAMW